MMMTLENFHFFQQESYLIVEHVESEYGVETFGYYLMRGLDTL